MNELDKFIYRTNRLKYNLNVSRNNLMDNQDLSQSEATWQILNHEICNLHVMLEDIKKIVKKNN